MARSVPGRPALIGKLTPGKSTEFLIGTTGRFRVSDIDCLSLPYLGAHQNTGRRSRQFQFRRRPASPQRLEILALPASGASPSTRDNNRAFPPAGWPFRREGEKTSEAPESELVQEVCDRGMLGELAIEPAMALADRRQMLADALGVLLRRGLADLLDVLA